LANDGAKAKTLNCPEEYLKRKERMRFLLSLDFKKTTEN
jgi:hypothetical protein